MRTQIPSTPRLGGALPAGYAAKLDSFLRSLDGSSGQELSERRGQQVRDLLRHVVARLQFLTLQVIRPRPPNLARVTVQGAEIVA